MSQQDADLSLSGVLDAVIGQALESIHVALPGRVETYDAAKQKASVQPLIKRTYEDDLGEHSELLPIITDVPVVFPGSGPYSITWPVAKGDTVMLIVASQSLDRWLVKGGVVDPFVQAGLNDAIAIPGLRDFAHPVPSTGVSGSAMVISSPGEVRIGGTQPLVTRAEFMAHTHVYAAGPAAGAITAVPTAIIVGTPKLRG